jgi:DNA-binding NarL/FixJ family response regulator
MSELGPAVLRDRERSPLRILLADDHDVVRVGVRALLERQRGWEICGEAENGLEAVEQVKRLRPDILIVDMKMPGLGGMEVIRQIVAAHPETEILVFSGEETESVARQCFEAGARGYLLKTEFGRQLIAAVEALRDHRVFVSPIISDLICSGLRRSEPNPTGDVSPNCLSARERETLHLLAAGASNKDVAAKLGISVRTAETHRAATMRKLGLKSLSELTRYAIRHALVAP